MTYSNLDPEVAKFLMRSPYEEQRSSTLKELKELILPVTLLTAAAYGGYRGARGLKNMIAAETAGTGKLTEKTLRKALEKIERTKAPTLANILEQGAPAADRDLLYQLSTRVGNIMR